MSIVSFVDFQFLVNFDRWAVGLKVKTTRNDIWIKQKLKRIASHILVSKQFMSVWRDIDCGCFFATITTSSAQIFKNLLAYVLYPCSWFTCILGANLMYVLNIHWKKMYSSFCSVLTMYGLDSLPYLHLEYSGNCISLLIFYRNFNN